MPEKLDFLTPTTAKVLKCFFDNPAEEVHEREIMRRAKVSKGSANKILRRLARLALLERAEKGRMVFYRLNSADPVVKQLKILNNLWGLRDFVATLRNETKKIILFGSCAEGTDAAESDIDLLILTDEKTSTREEVSRFNQDNIRKIAPILVDVHEYMAMRSEDKPLFERIDRGVVLWETF